MKDFSSWQRGGHVTRSADELAFTSKVACGGINQYSMRSHRFVCESPASVSVSMSTFSTVPAQMLRGEQ